MIKCTHCGKSVTIEDIKNGNVIVINCVYGYEVYCNNLKCFHDIKIIKNKNFTSIAKKSKEKSILMCR